MDLNFECIRFLNVVFLTVRSQDCRCSILFKLIGTLTTTDKYPTPPPLTPSVLYSYIPVPFEMAMTLGRTLMNSWVVGEKCFF